MPISQNNNSSFENEDSIWLNLPSMKNHFKSFSEVFYDQSENRSVRDCIKELSVEYEVAFNLEALMSDRKIREFGFAQYSSANETNDRIMRTNSNNQNYNLKLKQDCTANSECLRRYVIKHENEEKRSLSSKYPNHFIGELVASKIRFNKLMKLTKLIYDIGELQVDYKPNQTANGYAISSSHVHTSFTNTNALRKITSINGYRFFLDLSDFISCALKLPKLHNWNFRQNGHNNYCQRGYNVKNQVESHGSSSYRYYNMNSCLTTRMNHGSGKLLKTLENRAFCPFRDLDKTQEALRHYHNGLNKFLSFYRNIPVEIMENTDLYLRMDNKAHRKAELIIPKNTNFQNDTIRSSNLSLKEIRDNVRID